MATIGTFVSTDTASLQLSDPIVGFAVAAPSSTSAGKPETSGFTLADETQNGGMTGSLLASGDAVWVIASFLAFGLLLAFTPCVLPMYPILSATLAREGERDDDAGEDIGANVGEPVTTDSFSRKHRHTIAALSARAGEPDYRLGLYFECPGDRRPEEPPGISPGPG